MGSGFSPYDVTGAPPAPAAARVALDIVGRCHLAMDGLKRRLLPFQVLAGVQVPRATASSPGFALPSISGSAVIEFRLRLPPVVSCCLSRLLTVCLTLTSCVYANAFRFSRGPARLLPSVSGLTLHHFVLDSHHLHQ